MGNVERFKTLFYKLVLCESLIYICLSMVSKNILVSRFSIGVLGWQVWPKWHRLKGLIK